MKNYELIVYPLVFLWLFLLSLQGLDFTDTGFIISAANLFFEDQETILNQLSSIYFTLFLSSLFGEILPFGIYNYKLAYIVVVLITIIYSVKLIKVVFPDDGKIPILVFFIPSVVVLTYDLQGDLNFIHYNNLSLLFYVIITYTYAKGLIQGNSKYLISGGLFLFIAILTRLPNVLFLLPFSFILIFYPKKLLNTGYVVSGFLLGITGFILFLQIFGFSEYFFGGFQRFLERQSPSSSYSTANILLPYFYHLLYQLKVASLLLLALLPFVLAVFLIYKLQTNKVLSGISALGLGVLYYATVVFIWPSMRNILNIPSPWVTPYMVPVILLLILICWCLIRKNIHYETAIFTITTILALYFILPAGSNRSFLNYKYSLFLIFPTLGTLSYFSFSQKRNYAQAANILFFTSVILYGAVGTYSNTFRDVNDRAVLFHTVRNQKVWPIMTSSERAKVVEELLTEAPAFLLRGEKIVTFDKIPMAYYLLETKPYLKTTAPIYLPHAIFKAELENFSKDVPPVLLPKSRTENIWPYDIHQGLYMDSRVKNRNYLLKLITENNYEIVWQNDFFKLLKRVKLP